MAKQGQRGRLVKCQRCGYKSSNRHVEKHIKRVHNKENKYICKYPECSFNFKAELGLYGHLTKVHGLPRREATLLEGFKDPNKQYKVVATPLKKVIGDVLDRWYIGETHFYWNHHYSELRTNQNKCTDADLVDSGELRHDHDGCITLIYAKTFDQVDAYKMFIRTCFKRCDTFTKLNRRQHEYFLSPLEKEQILASLRDIPSLKPFLREVPLELNEDASPTPANFNGNHQPNKVANNQITSSTTVTLPTPKNKDKTPKSEITGSGKVSVEPNFTRSTPRAASAKANATTNQTPTLTSTLRKNSKSPRTPSRKSGSGTQDLNARPQSALCTTPRSRPSSTLYHQIISPEKLNALSKEELLEAYKDLSHYTEALKKDNEQLNMAELPTPSKRRRVLGALQLEVPVVPIQTIKQTHSAIRVDPQTQPRLRVGLSKKITIPPLHPRRAHNE